MIPLVVFVATLGIPAIAGLINSWPKRDVDYRHLVVFVAFGGALTAIIATVAGFSANITWPGPDGGPQLDPVKGGFIFIAAWIALISSGIASIGGFFGKGIQRAALVSFGPTMLAIYVLAALANFGN